MAQNGRMQSWKSAKIGTPDEKVACMTSSENDSRAKPSEVRTLAAELALTGPLTIERIAGHLGLSSRTLQRHLADQGASLRAIVEESRLEVARVLLCKTDLTVQEIAARSGYRTPSSFARAFVRWAGLPPRAWRNANRGPDRQCAGVARNGRIARSDRV